MKEMGGTEIIRDVMHVEGVTHQALAEMLGYRSPSAVTGRLSTPRISVDKMVEMLSAMGYEVVVRKRDSGDGTEWIVGE